MLKWVQKNLRGSAEYGSFQNEDSSETSGESRSEGSFVVLAKTKLYADSPAEHARAGDELVRKLRVDARGVHELNAATEAVLRTFPFERIRNFHFAEDNCFFVLVVHVGDGKFDNVVFRTKNQANALRGAIESAMASRRSEKCSTKAQPPLVTLEDAGVPPPVQRAAFTPSATDSAAVELPAYLRVRQIALSAGHTAGGETQNTPPSLAAAALDPPRPRSTSSSSPRPQSRSPRLAVSAPEIAAPLLVELDD